MFTGILSLKSDALIFEHQCAAVPLATIFLLCYFMFTTLDPLNVSISWVFIQGELTLSSFDVSAQVAPAVTGLALRLLLSQMLSSCRAFFSHIKPVPIPFTGNVLVVNEPIRLSERGERRVCAW